MKTKYLTENPEWVTFSPIFSSSLFLENAGYFDERPLLHTSITQIALLIALPFLCTISLGYLWLLPLLFFGWGKLYIYLPYKTGIQDCDSAAWGFHYHDDKIWIYIGGGLNFDGGRKWKTISMPWEYTWVRTSTLTVNEHGENVWFHETLSNPVNWSSVDAEGLIYGTRTWLDKNKWQKTYPFIDKYDGTEVNATISIEEREWRPRWFKFTDIFASKKKEIHVEFDKEVGEGKGSWKGGVCGCGYKLLPNETPYECLMRMQTEYKF